MMTPMQRYNAKRYLLNHLSCEAMITTDDFRECWDRRYGQTAFAPHADQVAKRLMKLARLQAKIGGTVLFITWKE